MLIKDCVVKHSKGDVWLHHTASGYKVRINAETLAVLESMLARRSAAEMTGNEKFIYDKLALHGMARPDTGREEDRRFPVKKKSFLDSVELEFSGRCNLRCAHCFSALSGKELGRETLRKVFAGIDALEPVNLVLSGGEPLLNSLLPEALAEARMRHMRISVMTNAALADERTADLFRRYGVARAVVSLDFFEKDHDELRGAGAYKRAVDGIRHFVAGKVPVFINALVRDGTCARAEEFRDFCLGNLGASGVRFSAVMPIGRAKNAAQGLGLSAAAVKDLFSRGLLPGGGRNGDAFTRSTGSRDFCCNAGTGQCFISADGRVYACHYFQNIGEAMGDLSAGPLERIYREYSAGGAIAADFDWEKLEKCRTCAHFTSCLGGCRARAKLLSGGWYEPDPFSCGMYGVARRTITGNRSL